MPCSKGFAESVTLFHRHLGHSQYAFTSPRWVFGCGLAPTSTPREALYSPAAAAHVLSCGFRSTPTAISATPVGLRRHLVGHAGRPSRPPPSLRPPRPRLRGHLGHVFAAISGAAILRPSRAPPFLRPSRPPSYLRPSRRPPPSCGNRGRPTKPPPSCSNRGRPTWPPPSFRQRRPQCSLRLTSPLSAGSAKQIAGVRLGYAPAASDISA